MFQFVKKLFNKDGQLVDYYIDMMAEKNIIKAQVFRQYIQ